MLLNGFRNPCVGAATRPRVQKRECWCLLDAKNCDNRTPLRGPPLMGACKGGLVLETEKTRGNRIWRTAWHVRLRECCLHACMLSPLHKTEALSTPPTLLSSLTGEPLIASVSSALKADSSFSISSHCSGLYLQAQHTLQHTAQHTLQHTLQVRAAMVDHKAQHRQAQDCTCRHSMTQHSMAQHTTSQHTVPPARQRHAVVMISSLPPGSTTAHPGKLGRLLEVAGPLGPGRVLWGEGLLEPPGAPA